MAGKTYLIDKKQLTEEETEKYILESRKKFFDGISGWSLFPDRASITLRMIQPKKGDRILDVGCGVGLFCYYIAQKYPSTKIVGIDISDDFIEGANRYDKLPNISYYKMNILNCPLEKNSFDCILFLEVLEHVENPVDFLRAIFGLLKPGGSLILSTPSALGITNISLNVRKQNLEYIEREMRDTGTEADHIYCWDKLTLYRLLNRIGFQHVKHCVSKPLALRRGQSLIFQVKKPEK
ncbi:Ubiquinone biosynthesis O-methyltransferase [Candidatus Gugararchaeum adminiculabundum]|nr:Ubiquinone biosynthesis O-methyltransferase [Candidatus Gugararchaeum adminiculabundum]